ncbi:hypothetical protein AGRA3207_001060 [Actinomadura graeca]|uniref:Uncharacterized protein n=1 Tax=Actinomadura graeca TaxID=2750812 RepID=A0ABX8QUA2_9ACTN|nr:hypothetical protein [Actinomadura graeca]QXJ20363.1 hypothetical protein AGRA3207_001060 [Actinomadura graeca]
MGDERKGWAGPDGLQVVAVRLTGAHRAWADRAGVQGETAFLVTRRGALVGYYPTVEQLAEVVDLAQLDMD